MMGAMVLDRRSDKSTNDLRVVELVSTSLPLGLSLSTSLNLTSRPSTDLQLTEDIDEDDSFTFCRFEEVRVVRERRRLFRRGSDVVVLDR